MAGTRQLAKQDAGKAQLGQQSNDKKPAVINKSPSNEPTILSPQSAHGAGCSCPACSQKSNSIDSLLSTLPKAETTLKSAGHDPGCQCEACSGKSNTIDNLLETPKAPELEVSMAGHDPGCQCEACSGKSNAINAILETPKKAESETIITGHEAGCQCDACSGKGNTINELLSAENLGPDESTLGKEQSNAQTVNSAHEAGCQCEACSGKATTIDDLLTTSAPLESSIQMTGHDPGCQCEACSSKSNSINELLNIPVKVETNVSRDSSIEQNELSIVQNPVTQKNEHDMQISHPQLNDTYSGDNRNEVMRNSMVGPGVTQPPIPNFLFSARSDETQTVKYSKQEQSPKTFTQIKKSHQAPRNRSDVEQKKQYVIGQYTYLDILTTQWLRKLYGHMIGLLPEEETKPGVDKTPESKQKKQVDDSKQNEQVNTGIKENDESKTDEMAESEESEEIKTEVHEPENLDQKNLEEDESAIQKKDGHESKDGERVSEEEMAAKTEIKSLSIRINTGKQKITTIKDEIKKIDEQIAKLNEQKKLEKDKTKKEEIQKSIEKLETKKSTLETKLKSVEKTLMKLQKLHLQKVVQNKLSKTKKIRDIFNNLKKGKHISPEKLKELTKREVKSLKRLLLDKKVMLWLLLGKKRKAKASVMGQIKRLLSRIRKSMGE